MTGEARPGTEPPPDPAPRPPAAPVIKLRREKRGGNREIVVLEGFPAGLDLDALAREIKRALGTGGTVKGQAIEIQGDHRGKLAELLLARGLRSKRAGG